MEKTLISLLVIEDNPADFRLFSEMLSGCVTPCFMTDNAKSLNEGIAMLKSGAFAAVILDLDLPDSHGLQTLAEMVKEGGGIPIIVMTGADDESLGIQAIRNKASDYLVKGKSDANLIARSIRYAIERKEKENELALANKELEAFSYSVSHDLRNPLNAIIACLEVLSMETGSKMGPDASKAVNHIIASVNRMAQVITDLLKLSGISRQEIHSENIDLSKMVRDFLEELKTAHPQRKVRFDIQPGLTMEGDPGLFRILVENLVRNAWKFTSRKEETHIGFGAVEKEGRLHYFIRDNGAGFDMKEAERLFKPYQRLHSQEDFKGSGIGLAMVKRIIERHGGKVWVEAEPDKGAAVFFSLG